MVAHLFIGLIVIALASLLITQGKRRRIWSILLLVALSIITYLFLNTLNNESSSGFIYQWLPYHQLRADFNISASLRMKELLQPLIYLLVIIILTNIINLKENYSLQISTLNLLSFTLLILLASSHDFFQLMFASSALSIICFYIPTSPDARKRFFIYNFLAEFTAFTALAVTYGRIDNISLNALSDFTRKGAHKDFVCILLMFSLACKMGFFLLNSHYKSLFSESINRVTGLCLLSQPLAGLIILSKLHPILTVTPWTKGFITVLCLLTATQGLLLLCFRNSFNLKIIGFYQAVFACSFYFIYRQPELLYSLAPKILLLLLLCTFSIYIATSRTQAQSSYLLSHRFNFISLIVGCLPLPLILIIWPNNYSLFCLIFTILYGILLKISCSPAIQKQITAETLSPSWNNFYNLSIIVICILFTAFNYQHITYNHYIIWAFVFIVLLTPINLLSRIGQKPIWQNDYLEKIYKILLLLPLRFFGRMLWLTFDFIFIERGIIASVVNGGKNILERLHMTQTNYFTHWIMYFIIGAAALIIYALGANQ